MMLIWNGYFLIKWLYLAIKTLSEKYRFFKNLLDLVSRLNLFKKTHINIPHISANAADGLERFDRTKTPPHWPQGGHDQLFIRKRVLARKKMRKRRRNRRRGLRGDDREEKGEIRVNKGIAGDIIEDKSLTANFSLRRGIISSDRDEIESSNRRMIKQESMAALATILEKSKRAFKDDMSDDFSRSLKSEIDCIRHHKDTQNKNLNH